MPSGSHILISRTSTSPRISPIGTIVAAYEEVLLSHHRRIKNRPQVNKIKRPLLIVLWFFLIFVSLWFCWGVCAPLCFFPSDIEGAYYEVPLPNHNKLTVNHLGYGIITNKDDDVLVKRANEIQVVKDYVVGRDSASFFALNTLTEEVNYYESDSQMKEALRMDHLQMVKPNKYYWNHRSPYDTLATILIAVLSFVLSLCLTKQKHNTQPTIINAASSIVWGLIGCYLIILESIHLLSVLKSESMGHINTDWNVFFFICGLILILVAILLRSRKRTIKIVVNSIVVLFFVEFIILVGVAADEGHWRNTDLFLLMPLSIIGFLLSTISLGRKPPKETQMIIETPTNTS